MSKLRRKKAAAEENKPGAKSGCRDLRKSLLSSDGDSSSTSSGSSRPWWAAADLAAVEKLWALTLQAFCPAVSSTPAMVFWVPELPETPTWAEQEEPSERHWCCLDEDVSELPALSDSLGCVQMHSEPHFSPNEGNRQPEASAQLLSETGGEWQTLSSPQRHLEDIQAHCLGDAGSLHRWTEKPDWSEGGECKRYGDRGRLLTGTQKPGGAKARERIKHGSHGDGAESTKLQGRKLAGRESERKSRAECDKAESGSSKSRTGSGTGSDGAVRGGSGSAVFLLENNSECKAGTSRGGSGSGLAEPKLECCPMCLMPFPAGFSQMECDCHLAQCLSEMNADVVW
ncbi:uncharacterized protein si:ch73-70k4.1 [Pygocentrus nattereri]|uniref:uncharacterized protein si:ch73-70k4.1 n=1 Tax=Pygocentrus nattereri TaxID=42514 RepID=UPI00081493EB|nr:uncharacterized protein si:ch73-70k4.1 [Pygocentrus nattereri]